MRLDLLEEEDLPVNVGRYKLLSLLGEGGMARVFKAEMAGDLGFRKPAAVKVVLPARRDKSQELQRQLVQEARVGGLLNHPNIIQTFDCGSLEGFPYIAMELVEGVALGELVEEAGPLPAPVALDVAIQSCRGLHHAHTATHDGQPLRVIHRDVKPSNLLIRSDGVVKLVDFGIAKAQVGDYQTTATGMTKGTPAYMSPEQLAAEELDARSDQFTLASVVWYSLTGRTLFGGASLTEVMMRIVQVEETLAREGLVDVSDRLAPGLGPVLLRMLAREPDDRFESMQHAEQALADIAVGLTMGSNTVSELIAKHFPERRAGAAAPYPRNWSDPSSPGQSARDLAAAALAADPDLLGGGVGPTVAMPAHPSPGATRAFPGVDKDMLPDGGLVGEDPTDQDWPFQGKAEEQLEEQAEEVPLSTQSRPAFRMPEQLPERVPSQLPATRDDVPRSRRAARVQEREAELARQRRLLLVVGALLGAVLVLSAFFGWRELQARADRQRRAELADIEPEPTTASATADLTVTPTPTPRRRTTPRRTPTPRATPAAVTPVPSLPAATPEPATEAPIPEPTPEVTPEPTLEVTPEPTPEVAPTPAPLPVRVAHTPLERAPLGASKFVYANVSGPSDVKVTVFFGEAGGPFTSKPMARTEDGRFRSTLNFAAPGRYEYWVVARAADDSASSGSRLKPHVITVY